MVRSGATHAVTGRRTGVRRGTAPAAPTSRARRAAPAPLPRARARPAPARPRARCASGRGPRCRPAAPPPAGRSGTAPGSADPRGAPAADGSPPARPARTPRPGGGRRRGRRRSGPRSRPAVPHPGGRLRPRRGHTPGRRPAARLARGRVRHGASPTPGRVAGRGMTSRLLDQLEELVLVDDVVGDGEPVARCHQLEERGRVGGAEQLAHRGHSDLQHPRARSAASAGQSSSMSRSAPTTRPCRMTSSASSARSFGAGGVTSTPSITTSSGPSTRTATSTRTDPRVALPECAATTDGRDQGPGTGRRRCRAGGPGSAPHPPPPSRPSPDLDPAGDLAVALPVGAAWRRGTGRPELAGGCPPTSNARDVTGVLAGGGCAPLVLPEPPREARASLGFGPIERRRRSTARRRSGPAPPRSVHPTRRRRPCGCRRGGRPWPVPT